MADSFEFREASHFTAGALGEPGARTFYIQAGDYRGHVTFKFEKQQAVALATFLRGVLDDLPAITDPVVPVQLVNPVEPAWTVGQIAVGTANDDEITIMIEELVFEDDEEDDDEAAFTAPEGGTCAANITLAQAACFVATVEELVSQSRPPCRICGDPLDPSGHVCPRLN